jgi:hypothetical protein
MLAWRLQPSSESLQLSYYYMPRLLTIKYQVSCGEVHRYAHSVTDHWVGSQIGGLILCGRAGHSGPGIRKLGLMIKSVKLQRRGGLELLVVEGSESLVHEREATISTMHLRQAVYVSTFGMGRGIGEEGHS